MLPCVIFEDEHLLVVNKPAGMNTHAPSPFAGEGIYDWLRHREPRWAELAIIHRLDKETSGIMVFGKTSLANRSLTDQFSRRAVAKEYLLLTDRPVKQAEFFVRSKITRAGERYVSGSQGELAETRFRVQPSPVRVGETSDRLKAELQAVEAEPLTGRTHQIRVHAAEKGFPILGDTLYGGSQFSRVCLHAAKLTFLHPVSGKELVFHAPVDFSADTRLALRASVIDPDMTNAFRIVHGASDGWPGWYVDRLGEFLSSQSEQELSGPQFEYLKQVSGVRGIYHKILNRQVRRASQTESSPQRVWGEAAPERFAVSENGVEFELSFGEGYSVGLFLDQRDNRRRLLTAHAAAGFPRAGARSGDRPFEMLNTFAYTCGFSVCAARAGMTTTSLDLSKKYLEWGRRNFVRNGIDPGAHDFIHGDVFEWLRRLGKKGRRFDLIALDPPTFSQSKEHGAFRVEKDYGKLVASALPLLGADGVMFASTNAAAWPAEKLLGVVEAAVRLAKRRVIQQHYVPQPPDFPVSRLEPAYLKTVWLRLG